MNVLQVWTGFINANDLASAAATLRTALKDSPGNSAYTRYLGETMRRQGDMTSALDLAHEAIRLAPDSPDGHQFLGIVHLRMGNLAAAKAAISAALQRAPDHVHSMLHMSEIALRQGDTNQAHAWADRVIAATPANHTGFIARADAHLALAELDYAEAALRQVLTILRNEALPSYKVVKQKIDYILTAKTHKSDA